MMEDDNKYIRFDWAAKRMLQDKANFGVFEGLITVLLNEPVHIVEILESESNQIKGDSTYGCVVLKAIDNKDEQLIVEIQTVRELYYLWNLVSNGYQPFTEHISLGDKYNKVKKVYSISILYFDLGQGADYLYHGQTSLVGVHTNDTLKINTRDKGFIKIKTPEEIFPEYFIIRVNEFNKVAKTPLEEWIDYLKSGHIKKDTTAPGLQEARQKLQYLKMDKVEHKPTTATLTISWYKTMCLILQRWKVVRRAVQRAVQKVVRRAVRRVVRRVVRTRKRNPHEK